MNGCKIFLISSTFHVKLSDNKYLTGLLALEIGGVLEVSGDSGDKLWEHHQGEQVDQQECHPELRK